MNNSLKTKVPSQLNVLTNPAPPSLTGSDPKTDIHPNTLVWRPLTWQVVLLSPLLYGMLIPLCFLDLCLTIYHWTVFPLLQIPLVQRATYIQIDRHHLAFLPRIVKLTCAYCGYANGLLQYAVRIAGETESYFCPTKHQATPHFQPPPHHQEFAEYGDRHGFEQRYLPDQSAQVKHRRE